MKHLAKLLTVPICYVLAFQPALEVVLESRALRATARTLAPLRASVASAQTPPPVIPLASPLRLTRTQSAHAIDDTAGGEITLAYHAVNAGTETVEDVLLVTRLAPGATLVESSPPAEVSGDSLAIVLPAVPVDEMATATLRIALPPGAAPLAIDAGASVFGSLRTREASDDIAPTVLPQSLGVDPALLASTPDAKVEDVDTQRAVALAGCDAGDVFRFVRDEVVYEAYRGSLRGSRGTLWSMAGNALDQASLLVAMLRACGIPARYATGTLDDVRARQLIGSMFAQPLGIVGGLDPARVPAVDGFDVTGLLAEATRSAPGADAVSDPESDPDLLETARRHAWVELWDGGGFVAADPSFADADLGDRFTATVQTFAEIPDALRHKVRFRLVEEEHPADLFNGILAAAYYLDRSGGFVRNGIKPVGNVFVQEVEVLDHTVPTVSLVGEPVTFGHFVKHERFVSTVEFIFNTYSPWLQIGRDTDVIRGADYQEAMATIVVNLAKIVTGLFVRMTTIDPDGNEKLYEHVYHDRFGLAQRLGEAPVGPPDLSGIPILSEANTIDVSVPVSDTSRRVAAAALRRSRDVALELRERFPTAATDDLTTYTPAQARELTTLMRDALGEVNRYDLASLSTIWDAIMRRVERFTGTRTYLAEPQLFVAGTYLRDKGNDTTAFGQSVDLRKFDVQVIPYPGERMSGAFLARVLSGQALTLQESVGIMRTADPSATALGTLDILSAAAQQGIAIRAIGEGNQLEVEELDLSPDARARIRRALGSGKAVVVPAAMVTIDGTTTTAWLETDVVTGDTIGVSEHGGHQSLVEFAVIARDVLVNMIGFLSEGLGAIGNLLTFWIDLPQKLEACKARGESCASEAQKALGGAVFSLLCTFVVPSLAALAFGPLGLFGFLAVAVTCAILGLILSEIQDELANDPPLLALGMRSFATEAPGIGVGRVSAGASLPSGPGTVTGQVEAAHARVTGEIEATHLAGPTDGSLALFPSAVGGIGAGGTAGAGASFAASTTASAAGGTLNLDFDAGSLAIGGDTLAGPGNVGFTGFDGALDATDAGATDAVVVDGTYQRVLIVDLDRSSAAASHDAGASFQATLRSNAADEYFVVGRAPAGFAVEVSDGGLVTVTPPFGIAPGAYEIRITAVAGELTAEAVALVDVTATAAGGLGVAFVEDRVFNVPQNGTLVLSNYRLEVFNGGLADDVFDVSVSGPPPADFTLAASAIAVPAGETGFVGVALHPAAGLLPPGSTVSLAGTATGRTSGLTGSASATFVYPEVAGVIPRFEPAEIFGAPGDAIPVELHFTGTGNGPSSFSLALGSAQGLGVSGLPAASSVGAGATTVLPVTVAIPPGYPAGATAAIAVVADLCAGAAAGTCNVALPSTRTAQLGVSVGTSGALCLFDAARRSLTGADRTLASALAAFGRALSELANDPATAALQSHAIATGNEVLRRLIAADLRASSEALSAALAEIASGDAARAATAAGSLCTTLAALPGEMEAAADAFAYGFTLGLAPASAVVAPGDPAVYRLRIASTGSQTTPVDLSLGLPAGVTGALSRTSVTLAPGETIDEKSASPVTLTLSAPAPVAGAAFDVGGVVATRPAVTAGTTGLFSAAEAAIDVAAVTANPSAVDDAGDPIAVRVELVNRANQARDVLVAWRVEDPAGGVLLTGAPVAARVGTGGGTTSVSLGTVDSTGFPIGNHEIVAQVTTPAGDPIQGRQGRGTFFVGLPFSAHAVATPALVPPGSSAAVTSSVVVAPRAVTQPGGFADQYADAVASSTGVADESRALGPPDGDVAVLAAGAELIVDMGAHGERIGDAPGDDLVVFERNPATCTGVHTLSYEVAVADAPEGPFTVLGTASGARRIGDGFDLASVGRSSARYVRIVSTQGEIGIDSVLAAHTVNPNHIRIERYVPGARNDGIASTPMIGDIDEDGRPEIVFTAQTGISQCEAIGIDGVTGSEDFRVTYPSGCAGGIGSCFCGNSSSPALGDLDLDGKPDVLLYQTVLSQVRLRAFKADGTEILSFTPARTGSGHNPVLENLDDDPEPEIVWPGGYVNLDGTTGMNNGIGGQPVAVDLDGDGQSELVMRVNWGLLRAFEPDGTQIWSTTLAGLTANLSRPAVADLDGDGLPDLVVPHAHDFGGRRRLTAVRGRDGTVLWENAFENAIGTCAQTGALCGGPHPSCTGGFGNACSNVQVGPGTTPTIADLDGDGEPEIATFMRAWTGLEDHVVAFESDGTFMWSTRASDPGGTEPGVSSADLNGDGKAEVLWNGWCDGFTILDGATGAILYRDPRAASASGGDNPTAGDVDDDGHVEVVTGSVDGLYVFGADFDWGPGRPVWNHLDYHVTNVEDDLTIPTSKAPSWLDGNTYRSQTAGQLGTGTASVVVTHDLGAAFSFAPGDITPPPSQVGGNVQWTETVTGPVTFDVPGAVPPLAPGESVVVSESSHVAATLTLPGGQAVNLSIPLGPVTVTAAHVVALDPELRAAPAGSSADFVVRVENLRASAETFALTVVGVDPSGVSLAPSVTVAAGDVVEVPLRITTATAAPTGQVDFLVVASGDQGTLDRVWGSIDVGASALLPGATGVLVEIDPAEADVGKPASTTVVVKVTNTGRTAQTFDLTAALPHGITGTFAEPSLLVQPGPNAGRTTGLVLEVPVGAPIGLIDYGVTATAQGLDDVSGTATAKLDVARYGVLVELAPETVVATPSGAATVLATITNPGTGTGRFDLDILGPLAPWACFDAGVGSCTPTVRRFLNAGGSATIPVVLSGLPSLARQTAVLAVRATVTDGSSSPRVTGIGDALVEIAGERGLGLEVEPVSISDDTLGPLPFEIRIANTGNLCDERYTMTFTSEPSGVVVTPETTSFVVPAGSTALLGAWATAPAFGTFDVQVHVETAAVNPLCPGAPAASADAQLTLVLSGDDAPPVADAGDDRQAVVGVPVSVDGSQSYDPNGGTLLYAWTFASVPPGSALTSADITGASSAQASFTPDVPGAYVLALDVSDGQLADRDTTTVTAAPAGTGPVADAGPDQQVRTGELVRVDGSGSHDPGGALVTFAWTIVGVPAGSAVDAGNLSDPSDAQPTFTPDVDGEFTFEVTVANGTATDTDTVVVTARPSNAAPVADAGRDQGALLGAAVALDGSGSFDPDDGPAALEYRWTFLETPAASALGDADIAGSDQPSASFTPDVSGRYVLELAVSDGDRTSGATVVVRAGEQNVPPVADAGDDPTSVVGGSAVLDASRSNDADQAPAPLAFAWRFVALPAGSALTAADLRDAATAFPSFTPDVAGTFVLRVLVSDGLDDDADNVAVRVERPDALAPTGDLFVRRADPNVNEGASSHLMVRGSSAHALIRFDQSEIAAVLAGRELLSARVELRIDGPRRPHGWRASGGPLEIHRLTAPWTEGNGFDHAARPRRNRTRGTGPGATWFCATDAAVENRLRECEQADWAMRPAPQGGRQGVANPWVASATDSATIANGQTGTIVLDVTEDVRAFLAGAPNHGWILVKTPRTGGGTVWLSSREGPVPPRLVLTTR